jgi:hypothetical protein
MMSRKHSTIQIRLYLIGGAILLAGLLCAAWLYLTATDYNSNIIGYEIVDGHEYAITPIDSKRYLYDLERIVGKSAVVAVEINQWFASLLHGKRLAYTLALLAIGVALACFLVAQHPDYKLPDHRNEGEDG